MLIGFLCIYPQAIESAKSACETALEQMGISTCDLDNEAEHAFKECSNLDDITNSIIYAYFETTKGMIEAAGKNVECSYYINCDDSHFYINGEEMY